jgi:AcrR family transcriptional regulator
MYAAIVLQKAPRKRRRRGGSMAADTRVQIIRQAILYFAANDYDRATLDDIVKALGVTKGAVYHYFTGKEDLFRSAVTHVLDSLEVMFEDMNRPGLTPENTVGSLLQMDHMMSVFSRATGVESLSDYLNLYSLFLAAMKKFPEIGERMAATYKKFIDLTSDRLKEAQDAGFLGPDADTEALAFLLVGFGEGAMLLGAVVPGIDAIDLGTRAYQALQACLAKAMEGATGAATDQADAPEGEETPT